MFGNLRRGGGNKKKRQEEHDDQEDRDVDVSEQSGDDSDGDVDSSSADEDLGGASSSKKTSFKKSGSAGQDDSTGRRRKRQSYDEATDKASGKVKPGHNKQSSRSASISSSAERKRREKEEQEMRSREQASIEHITAKDLVLKVDKDDLESRHKVLKAEEVVDFVSVPILDASGPAVVSSVAQLTGQEGPVIQRQSDADNCRGRVLVPCDSARHLAKSRKLRWKEEVFVENLNGGKFSRVLYDLDDTGKRVSRKSKADDQKVSQFSPQKLRELMNNVEYILEGLFMVGQGLLAGGTFFQLIVVLQINDPYTLLGIYGPLASKVRRMFFYLSVVSFVGVCDKITAERNQRRSWSERSGQERAEMYMYGLLYFMCLLFTLLVWPLVDEINVEYEASVTAADQGSSFSVPRDFDDTLQGWRVFIGLRFAAAILGWVLVCKDTNRDLLRGRQRFAQIEALESDVEKANDKVAKMSGRRLDGVSVSELQSLRSTLATGLEEVTIVLDVRRRTSEATSG